MGIYNIRIIIYSVTNSYSYANHFIEQYLQHFHSPNTFHLRLLPITSFIQNILQKYHTPSHCLSHVAREHGVVLQKEETNTLRKLRKNNAPTGQRTIQLCCLGIPLHFCCRDHVTKQHDTTYNYNYRISPEE